MDEQHQLKRSLSTPLLTAYGLGTILGAGIYVLVGKIAGIAGIFAPIAFLIAAIIATFTAISYAELSARFPFSAGEAYYVNEGFKQKWLAGIVGWLVVLTGVVSAATLTKGFIGYLHVFIIAPPWLSILILVCVMATIAAWGIIQSVTISALITLLEVLGLILVLIIAGHNFQKLPAEITNFIPTANFQIWWGIILGAFVAFYAFIGFEDMVNVAEEVKAPQRTLPISIFLALSIATVLYVLIALVAVLALPIHALATSDAPLALIMQHQGYSPTIITLISLVAIINGALVQIIMAARVIYGMAKQKNAPRFLAHVNKKTKTPILATLLVSLIILILALWFPLINLAKTTSFIILWVFLLVNLSLVIIKWRKPKIDNVKAYPMLIPIIGSLLTFLFILVQLIQVF